VTQVSPVTAGEAAVGRATTSLREVLRARAAAHAIPLKAALELTKRCNLSCYQCYVSQPGVELGTERVVEIVGELADAGCMSVTLTGGEVGLRRDFLLIAGEVKRQRMQLTVLTNGTAFDDEVVGGLARIKPSLVAVSFYGATAAAHEQVTGIPGSFERAVRTVRLLRSLGVRCRLHGVLLKDTCDQFAAIAELAEAMGCDWRFDPSVAPTEEGDLDVVSHRVPVERLSEFFRHPLVEDRFRKHAASQHKALTPSARTAHCPAGMTAVFVAADGDVFACMGFPPSFGNVAGRSFREVWHSPAAEAHRRRMRQPLAGCQECELSRYCTVRCPRVALVEDGDVSGPSKRACELAGMVRDWREHLLEVG